MAGKSDIKITAGIEVEGNPDGDAEKVFSPWEKRAKAVGGAIKQAFTGAISDVSRALTIGNAISFASALQSARQFREEVGRLSAIGGPVGELRTQIDSLGKMHLLRSSEILQSEKGLRSLTFGAKDAIGALGALQDEALATGTTIGDKLPLAATLMNGMGISAGQVGDELGRVRTLADGLGTAGGLVAAEKRLESIAGVLIDIGVVADKDRGKLEALVLGIGKNLPPAAGGKVAANLISSVSSNREQLAAIAGMPITSLTNPDGSLNMEALQKVLPRVQRWARRQSKDRGMQQMIMANILGGDRQTGAAALDEDFSKLFAAGETAKPSSKTKDEAKKIVDSEAGQAIGRTIAQEKTAREGAETLLPIADASQSLLAQHPVLGMLGLGAAGNLLAKGVGWGAGKLATGAITAATAAPSAPAIAAAGGTGLLGVAGGIATGAGVGGTLLAGTVVHDQLLNADLMAAARKRAAGILPDLESGRKRMVGHWWGGTSYEDVKDPEEQKKAAAAFRALRGGKFDPNDPASAGLSKVGASPPPVGGQGAGEVMVMISPESISSIAQALGSQPINVQNYSENVIEVNRQQHGGAIKN
jgi:hypothetical protein